VFFYLGKSGSPGFQHTEFFLTESKASANSLSHGGCPVLLQTTSQ